MGVSNEEIIMAECITRGICEEVHTYAGWQRLGYQVQKGQRALFKTGIWRFRGRRSGDVPAGQAEPGDAEKMRKNRDKVDKLWRLSKSSNPAEAQAAREKAQEIIDKYKMDKAAPPPRDGGKGGAENGKSNSRFVMVSASFFGKSQVKIISLPGESGEARAIGETPRLEQEAENPAMENPTTENAAMEKEPEKEAEKKTAKRASAAKKAGTRKAAKRAGKPKAASEKSATRAGESGDAASREPGRAYRYYSVCRPVAPGTYPQSAENPAVAIGNYDEKTMVDGIGREAWGYVEYRSPLSEAEIYEYELAGE